MIAYFVSIDFKSYFIKYLFQFLGSHEVYHSPPHSGARYIKYSSSIH